MLSGHGTRDEIQFIRFTYCLGLKFDAGRNVSPARNNDWRNIALRPYLKQNRAPKNSKLGQSRAPGKRHSGAYHELAVLSNLQYESERSRRRKGRIKMPCGPQGQKRSADVIGCDVIVAKIATDEINDTKTPKSGRTHSWRPAERRAPKSYRGRTARPLPKRRQRRGVGNG
jgi:hypothetical protein